MYYWKDYWACFFYLTPASHAHTWYVKRKGPRIPELAILVCIFTHSVSFLFYISNAQLLLRANLLTHSLTLPLHWLRVNIMNPHSSEGRQGKWLTLPSINSYDWDARGRGSRSLITPLEVLSDQQWRLWLYLMAVHGKNKWKIVAVTEIKKHK